VALLHEQGVWPAMGAFMALAGSGAPDGEDTGHDTQHAPPPEQVAALERMIGRGLLTVCGYPLDVPALRGAQAGGVRLVLAAGKASRGQLARRCAEAVAGRLGRAQLVQPSSTPWRAALACAASRTYRARPGATASYVAVKRGSSTYSWLTDRCMACGMS